MPHPTEDDLPDVTDVDAATVSATDDDRVDADLDEEAFDDEEGEESEDEESEEEDTLRFADLGLDARILKNLDRIGFETPTPIQAQALPVILEGHDLIGRAKTGSGKTAAFGLGLLQAVADGANTPRALVLLPTRELAQQVCSVLQDLGKGLANVDIISLFGGVAWGPQERALKKGGAIVVGTPGRTLDHVRKKNLVLDDVECLVLDEADEMLRMGFIEDVETVLEACPDDRQVALFSATMPPAISRIAKAHLQHPKVVQVEGRAHNVDHIDQRYVLVPPDRKRETLLRFLTVEKWASGLIFTRTRRGCAELSLYLAEAGYRVTSIHSDLDMAARTQAMNDFRAGKMQLLIATDIAARGIDVAGIEQVVNFDLPDEMESYVHRIGRTGRGGEEGKALSFATRRERFRIQRLQKHLKADIRQVQVPSDRALQAAKRGKISEALKPLLDADIDVAGLLDDMRSQLVDDGVDAEGLTDDVLLRSAFALLCSTHDLDVHDSVSDEPPAWAQDEASGRQKNRNNDGQIEVVLQRGKADGVHVAAVLEALHAQCGLTKQQVGNIGLRPKLCFVWLPADVATALVDVQKNLVVEGGDIEVRYARTAKGGGKFGGGGKGRDRRPPGKPHRGQGPRRDRDSNWGGDDDDRGPRRKRSYGATPNSKSDAKFAKDDRRDEKRGKRPAHDDDRGGKRRAYDDEGERPRGKRTRPFDKPFRKWSNSGKKKGTVRGRSAPKGGKGGGAPPKRKKP